MCEALEGLSGIAIMADDILVFGSGDSQEDAIMDHDKNLQQLLERCRNKNLKINKEKMRLQLTELKYIGHVSKIGIRTDEQKYRRLKI